MSFDHSQPFISRVRSTMKSPDTEGAFELYMTRTPGYVWALFFRKIGFHPIAVTLISILHGVGAGYFFLFEDLRYTAMGILLLIVANWLDCADGQLARMTGKKTLIGRVLDGFAGDLWFFSIYFFICLRLTSQPAPWGGDWGVWIWLIAAFSGFYCHARQCSLADYYRNIHLFFVYGKNGSELDRTSRQRERMNSLKWCSSDWFEKLYLFFYIRYTRSQEEMTPAFQSLYAEIMRRYPDGDLPEPLRKRFRRGSLPLMPLTNILTFDLRVIILFTCLLLSEPWVFFVVEIFIFELLRHYMRKRHEQLCREIGKEVARG